MDTLVLQSTGSLDKAERQREGRMDTELGLQWGNLWPLDSGLWIDFPGFQLAEHR